MLAVMNLRKVTQLVCGSRQDILGQAKFSRSSLSLLCIERCVPVLGPEIMVSVAYFGLGLICYL